jgi:polynucleotide 5'-hydroxyl-kinase GRC3/NOL9
MNKTLEKGKTLLVDGPASVTIISGKAQIFGFQIKDSRKIIIREGKRLPFAVEDTTYFSISLGANAVTKEIDGDTIPTSWIEASDILEEFQKRPVTVMVIGAVDSGKTSFCTYLTNKLVSMKRKVAILDEDLGQSEIGPPGTVAYTCVSGPVSDFYNVQEHNAVFIGATSPQGAVEKTIQASILLKNEIISKGGADFMIVNTDGWVSGEEAIEFKARLATALGVDVVFCLQKESQMPSLCATFGDALACSRQERVDSPSAIGERSKEMRKTLRELGYEKSLKNARLKVLPIKYLAFEGDKTSIWNGKAENMLIGIYDARKKFLGIGIIRKIDHMRKAIKIYTAVTTNPSSIVLGKIWLSNNLKEISEEEIKVERISG